MTLGIKTRGNDGGKKSTSESDSVWERKIIQNNTESNEGTQIT